MLQAGVQILVFSEVFYHILIQTILRSLWRSLQGALGMFGALRNNTRDAMLPFCEQFPDMCVTGGSDTSVYRVYLCREAGANPCTGDNMIHVSPSIQVRSELLGCTSARLHSFQSSNR